MMLNFWVSGERVGDLIFATNSVYAKDNRVKVSEELFEDPEIAFPDGIHGGKQPSLYSDKYTKHKVPSPI
jgi:hypothetical protein